MRRALTDRLLRDVWADRPQLEAFGLGCRSAYHAADHMFALAVAIRSPNVVMALSTLIRAAVESTARAAYLLQPDIDERERVRRWLNDLLYSDLEDVRLLHGLADPQAHHYADDLLTKTRARLDAARAHRFTVEQDSLTPDRRGRIHTPHLDHRRPSTQALIGRLLDDAGIGDLFHRWTSRSLHASESGLMSYISRGDARDSTVGPGMSLVPVVIDSYRLAVLLAVLVDAADRLASSLFAVAGRDPLPWQVKVQPIRQQISRMVAGYARTAATPSS